MIATDWEFNGFVPSPSGYGSSRSFSSLETNDANTMDIEFMRFREDEEEEEVVSDDINVHGHAKPDLALSRSDSNVSEEDASKFKADHGFRRMVMTPFATDSDVNDDHVGETAGITEQVNAPASRGIKGKGAAGSSRNGPRVCPRVCADCLRTTTPLWRSGPQGPKSLCNACGIRYNKKKRAMIAATAAAAAGSVSYKKRSSNSWKIKSTRTSLETAHGRQIQFSEFYKCHDINNLMQKGLSRLPILIKVERSFGELEQAAASLMAIKFGHPHA